jgi:hypothetical protein
MLQVTFTYCRKIEIEIEIKLKEMSLVCEYDTELTETEKKWSLKFHIKKTEGFSG